MSKAPMSLRCKIYDWYELHDGYTLLLRQGYTALIGPNGAGKTTLLNQLEGVGKKRKYKVLRYSNLSDGGHIAANSIVQFGNAFDFARLVARSEGQSIVYNFGEFVSQIAAAVKETRETGVPLLILLDSLDSGTSIDKQRELMKFFNHVALDTGVYSEHGQQPVYVVAAVNSYELLQSGNIGMDVRTGESLSFGDYSEYARFICEYFENHQKTAR